jgi:hypothetical protein
MAAPRPPRTFFLNESHEHTRGEKDGGGLTRPYVSIDWKAKGARVATSLRAARESIRRTPDPSKGSHLFLISTVEEKLERVSDDKRKAKDGRVVERSHIAGEHSLIFQRLGLDLLGITEGGKALVHAANERLDNLLATADGLESAGAREQRRWAFLSDFAPAPPETRADPMWIASIPDQAHIEVIVEIQPLLVRSEVESVAQSLRVHLDTDEGDGVLAAGRDFSGRSWFRMRLRRQTIQSFARDFQSIQSIHAPLRSILFGTAGFSRRAGGEMTAWPPVTANLPAVAIVDTGVPREHRFLAPYRRGQHAHPEVEAPGQHDHASRVASRIVFGDFAAGPAFVPPAGRCQYLDVVVPGYPALSGEDPIVELDDKAIQDELTAVVMAYPDVRVFNFSFGRYEPLARLDEHQRRERLLQLQDLDNFIFANDLLVVVAAGNSPPGAIPNNPYPDHVDDPDWGLGARAAGFNTMVVGSYAGTASPGGIAGHTGWPSPFTRIGPGVANAPVPGFSANGGDVPTSYRFREGMGVGTCNRMGDWEDAIGTSLAAPLVAREAAILLRQLQRHCATGVLCFSATVKAFLQLVARRVGEAPRGRVRALADRTLGKGLPKADRLERPHGSTAVFVWQGTLDSHESVARVRVPVPAEWMKCAQCPSLRIVCTWNALVNAAAPDIWASRKVTLHLKPTLGADAIRGKGDSVGAYPLIDRIWRLDHDANGKPRLQPPDGDWIVELFYDDVGPYPATLAIPPQQKVALVMELFDQGENPVSPQEAVQSLPVANTMIQLAGVPQGIQIPVKVQV